MFDAASFDCVSVIDNNGVPVKYQTNGNNIITFGGVRSANTMRYVDIINGKQNIATPPTGTWIRSLKYSSIDIMQVVAPAMLPRRIVFVGDSIIVGADATDPSTSSMTGLLRLSNWNTCNVVAFGSGSQSLFNMNAEDAGFTNTAKLIKDYGTTDAYIAIGMNDYNNETFANKEEFATYYEMLVDEISEQSPATTIILQSIIPPALNTNDRGDTYLDYRTIVSNIATARGLQYIDGNNCITRADMGTGSHPTNAGYRIYATYVASQININAPL